MIIDCPPALGILTLNVFTATDHLVVPLQCEYYALEGISSINRVIGQLRPLGVSLNGRAVSIDDLAGLRQFSCTADS